MIIRAECYIIFYKEVIIIEKRIINVSISRSGGTAGGEAKNYKISLPSAWIKEIGIGLNEREVELSFDGSKIILSKKGSLSDFLKEKQKAGHKLKLFHCYCKDALCAKFAADETDQSLCVENKTDDVLKLPFGNKQTPTWQDYRSFLEDRCVPKARAGLREYLETIGIDHYDPLEIIKKTQGKMAEDDLWFAVEEIG